MAEAVVADAGAAPAKKGGKGLLVGLVLALLLGGGGFYATFSGLLALPFGEKPAEDDAHAKDKPPPPLAPTAFLPLEKIVISLGARANARHLQVGLGLEVVPESKADVELLVPRILDVANTYLRAVEVRDLEEPAALARIRAQLLRRIQIVTGEGRVRDLLVTEFVLN